MLSDYHGDGSLLVNVLTVLLIFLNHYYYIFTLQSIDSMFIIWHRRCCVGIKLKNKEILYLFIPFLITVNLLFYLPATARPNNFFVHGHAFAHIFIVFDVISGLFLCLGSSLAHVKIDKLCNEVVVSFAL